MANKKKKTIRIHSMSEKEKNYFGLILMAKYVGEATDWSEKEFVNTVYRDYRFEYILGSAFLSVTGFSGIYGAVCDLMLSLGYVGAIRAVSRRGITLLKEKTLSDFKNIFNNRDCRELRQQFCTYYGLS